VIDSPGGLGSLLWFVAVIAMIPLALWLLKRSPMGTRLGGGPVRPVATLPLSAQQKIVTVEVGQGDDRRWLVLGVTPGSINLITSLNPTEPEVAASSTPAEGFNLLLNRLKNSGPKP
jgi:flagellar protein FliO/FliZ